MVDKISHSQKVPGQLQNLSSGLPISATHTPSVGQDKDISFKDLITKAIEEVNKLQLEADAAMTEFAKTGDPQKLPEVITKIKKAEIAFDLLIQVRNKVIDAYNDIQRMPL